MTVVITKPASGAKIKGTAVPVEASYDGQNFNIATVSMNGVQLASDTATPIFVGIDTTRVIDGSYTLTVAVRYRAGGGKLRWQKASIPVVVDNASVPVPTKPPAIPTGLKAAIVNQNQVELDWANNPAGDNVDLYQVYVDDANHNLSVQGSEFVVTGLAAGSTHQFRVSAHNANGYGDWTEPVSATIPGSPDPTPVPPDPIPSTAYFVEDYSTGRFDPAKWDRLHSYGAPGWLDIPYGGVVGTPDGRVAIVNDPAGSGKKCARLEIRDADPDWASGPGIDKSEIVMSSSRTWNGSFSVGTVRWFEWDMYLPNTASEKFEIPRGDSFFGMFGFHPPGPTGWSAFHIEWNPYLFRSGGEYADYKNIQLNMLIAGGVFDETTYQVNYHLLPLWDANGNRIAANFNRWIHIVWGLKFNPDNSGWFEAWIDGKLVVPRVNRPTMWTSDGQNYFKYGIYRHTAATFPETGKCVAYFGRTTIGKDRPF